MGVQRCALIIKNKNMITKEEIEGVITIIMNSNLSDAYKITKINEFLAINI